MSPHETHSKARIMAHRVARELRDEELPKVGGGVATYCFHEHLHDDANPGCQIP